MARNITPRINFFNSLVSGALMPMRALALIARSPSLLGIVAVPLSLNLVLYVLFFHWGAHYLNEMITQALGAIHSWIPGWMPGWLASTLVWAMSWAIKITAWGLLILTAALSFSVVGGILAAPFNDILCKRTASLIQRGRAAPHALQATTMQVIGLELKRTAILVILGLTALAVGIIPFLQLPAACLGACALAFEYLGYPISQHSHELRTVWAFIGRYPALSLGFGLSLLLMMALPFTSLFYIPLAVVGSTILYLETTESS